MRESPLITIAIPNYNYARFLRKCIESAVTQKGEDIEILVADNCSTDESWSIIQSFQDGRMRAFRHEKNIGLYPNWNFLLQNARGKYFKLLQSDDWLGPNFLLEARNALHNSRSVAYMIFGCKHVNAEGIEFGSYSPESLSLPQTFTPDDCFAHVLASLDFSMPTLNLVNANMAREVGGYVPENAMRSDTIMVARLLARNARANVTSCYPHVVFTRTHGQNDRRKYSRFAAHRDELIYLRELKPLAAKDDAARSLNAAIRKADGQALLSCFIDFLRRKNVADFARSFRWVVENGEGATTPWNLVNAVAASALRKAFGST